MAIYLKKFETQADYEAAESGLILPNVSLILEDGGVKYTQGSPTPSYEAIDLGLPSGTKWANMNVGATSEADYGNYYQWGKGADDYFVTSGQSSNTATSIVTSADTAAQVMGEGWKTPGDSQFNELINNTTFESVTINGVVCGKLTSNIEGYTDKFIYLPLSGSYDNGSFSGLNINGKYWSRNGLSAHNSEAYYTIVGIGGIRAGNDGYKNRGYSVRGVMNA